MILNAKPFRLRLHPLDAISGVLSFLVVLALPLALFLLRGQLSRALSIQGLAVVVISVLGVLRHRHSRLSWDGGVLRYRRGLFLRTEDVIPGRQLVEISLSRPPLLRLVGAVRLRLYTRAGEMRGVYPVLLTRKNARILWTRWTGATETEAVDLATVGRWAVANISAGEGLYYLAAAVIEAGQLLRSQLAYRLVWLSEVLGRLLTLPPVLTVWGIVALLSGIFSALHALERGCGMESCCREGLWEFRGGALSPWQIRFRVGEVSSVTVAARLLTYRFGGRRVLFSLGSGGRGLPCSVPIRSLREGSRLQNTLLLPLERRIRVNVVWKRAFPRYLLPPVLVLMASVGVGLLIQAQLQLRGAVTWVAVVIGSLPALGRLVHRWLALFYTSVAISETGIDLTYEHRGSRCRTRIPRGQIAALSLSRRRFFGPSALCTLTLRENCRRAGLRKILGLPYDRVVAALAQMGYCTPCQTGKNRV